MGEGLQRAQKEGDAKDAVINAIEATINCNCTVNCGQKGGTPGPGDTLVPSLVH